MVPDGGRPLAATPSLAADAWELCTRGRHSRRWTAARRQETDPRSEEHTSELQSLMRISYAVFCLNKKKTKKTNNTHNRKNPTKNRNRQIITTKDETITIT